MSLRSIPARYFNSWWIPAAFSLLLLAALTFVSMFGSLRFAMAGNILFNLFCLSFAGVLSAAIWNFFKRRWIKGVVHLLMLPVCLLALGICAVFTTFGSGNDGFADNLTIPANINVTEPLPQMRGEGGSSIDLFQKTLLSALFLPGSEDPTITASVTSLASLSRNHPEILNRYLASSPAWRVFEERENIFSTRRWVVGSEWEWSLHGYYTRFNLDPFGKSGLPDFQSRLTIGLSGKSWWKGDKETTQLTDGQTSALTTSQGNGVNQSHCVISVELAKVEVFEQSDAKERRLTKASLAHIESELAPLAVNPTWETIRRLLPEGSITRGSPSIELRNSSQTGIYASAIRVNPGEPGRVYLKAYEVTKGTPLSEKRLKDRSNEWVGWSADPEELFLSATEFMIYEGDWGKPYAARFEVWFIPDSAAPESKLLEKIFKIEGWQR